MCLPYLEQGVLDVQSGCSLAVAAVHAQHQLLEEEAAGVRAQRTERLSTSIVKQPSCTALLNHHIEVLRSEKNLLHLQHMRVL